MEEPESVDDVHIEVVGDPTAPGLRPEVEKLFIPLRNEIVFLHGNWEVFRQIFQDANTAAAIKVTPGGFAIIRLVFRHEIIMGFSRITDRKVVAGKQTLTLRQLHHAISGTCDDVGFVDRLKFQLEEIEKTCDPFRKIRNRTIAHLDLLTFLKEHPDALLDIDGPLVEKCLKMLSDFMNAVLHHFTTTPFDFVPHISPAPRNIVHDIKEYRRWLPEIHKIERQRILNDEPLP